MSTIARADTEISDLSGRCLCGAVSYRAGPPLYPATFCHCESCRRAAGANAVGWVTVAKHSASFSAKPQYFASSPGVERSFCGVCGSPLSYCNAQRPGELDFTVCSLDDHCVIAPVDHIWMVDALPWDRPADGLPQYQRTRGA